MKEMLKMPVDKIMGFPKSSPGWDLIKTLYTYYGLKDYLEFKYYDYFRKDIILEIYAYKDNLNIPGEQIFWRDIATGQLQEEDKIKLYNFQISSWFPRKPGIYWTYSAALARRKAWRNHIEKVTKDMIVFDIWGKTLMSELGGVGSVNIRKNRNNVLLTATASGLTDAGIPLICPQSIWKKIAKELKANKRVEVDIRGTIKNIPVEYDSFFLRNPCFPKVAVVIDSILNIDFKVSDLNIKVCPWTLFEIEDGDYPYGFTFVTHDLIKDELQDSINSIIEYIDQKKGKLILTDFDENTNSLNAKFPLNSLMDGTVFSEDVFRYCQEIKRKFERTY